MQRGERNAVEEAEDGQMIQGAHFSRGPFLGRAFGGGLSRFPTALVVSEQIPMNWRRGEERWDSFVEVAHQILICGWLS
jgi:hypothetical protein